MFSKLGCTNLPAGEPDWCSTSAFSAICPVTITLMKWWRFLHKVTLWEMVLKREPLVVIKVENEKEKGKIWKEKIWKKRKRKIWLVARKYKFKTYSRVGCHFFFLQELGISHGWGHHHYSIQGKRKEILTVLESFLVLKTIWVGAHLTENWKLLAFSVRLCIGIPLLKILSIVLTQSIYHFLSHWN